METNQKNKISVSLCISNIYTPSFQMLLILFLSLVSFFSCKQETKKAQADSKPGMKDTLWIGDEPYVELLDANLDSSAYIKSLTSFAIEKLKLHANKQYFDTTALFAGY